MLTGELVAIFLIVAGLCIVAYGALLMPKEDSTFEKERLARSRNRDRCHENSDKAFRDGRITEEQYLRNLDAITRLP